MKQRNVPMVLINEDGSQQVLSTNNNTKLNFLSRVIIILALYGFAVFAVLKNAEWWDTNPNFEGKSWIFKSNTIIAVLLILVLIYLFLWFMVLHYNNTTFINIRIRSDIYFSITITFFYISFITIFIDKKPDVSLIFGIFALMMMVFLSTFVYDNCNIFIFIVSLINIPFMVHFIIEVYHIQKC